MSSQLNPGYGCVTQACPRRGECNAAVNFMDYQFMQDLYAFNQWLGPLFRSSTSPFPNGCEDFESRREPLPR